MIALEHVARHRGRWDARSAISSRHTFNLLPSAQLSLVSRLFQNVTDSEILQHLVIWYKRPGLLVIQNILVFAIQNSERFLENILLKPFQLRTIHIFSGVRALPIDGLLIDDTVFID